MSRIAIPRLAVMVWTVPPGDLRDGQHANRFDYTRNVEAHLPQNSLWQRAMSRSDRSEEPSTSASCTVTLFGF